MNESSLPVPAEGLVLVCQLCRWRPPGDLEMALVQAHFDLESGHDPEDIRLALVAWCARCDAEMPLTDSRQTRSGAVRHTHTCPLCHRTRTLTQRADA